MKAAFKKIISSFMFCIALLPLIFTLHIQITAAVIHHQMKEKLERQNVVTIHIKSPQLEWIKKRKEASVNGNMFDVKSYSIKGDDIMLTGLFDKDEDALFAQIDNTDQKNNTEAGNTMALKWFSCFWWNVTSVTIDILSSEVILSKAIQQNTFLQNPVLSCDTPPPKFSSI